MNQKNHLLDADLKHYSITARTVLSLKPPTKHLGEIALYTAAAGSALALAPAAEAAIIYSGIRNITVKSTGPVAQVDLNGKDDIRFGIYQSGINATQFPANSSGFYQMFTNAFLSAPGGRGAGIKVLYGERTGRNPFGTGYMFPPGGVLRLNASAAGLNGKNNYNPPLNTVVPGGTQWVSLGNNNSRYFIRDISTNRNNTYSSIGGFWNPGITGTVDGFAGIQLANNDFGWLQFKLTTSTNLTNSLTLVDWAYQSVPGASIHVGDTGSSATPSVPEPSTLSLMALGAAGIATLRRRRKQEKSPDQVH